MTWHQPQGAVPLQPTHTHTHTHTHTEYSEYSADAGAFLPDVYAYVSAHACGWLQGE